MIILLVIYVITFINIQAMKLGKSSPRIKKLENNKEIVFFITLIILKLKFIIKHKFYYFF